MQPWVGPLIGAVIGLVTFFGTIVVQSRAAARIEGALGAEVKNHSETLRDLKAEQDQQWSKIGDHGERIRGLEIKTERL
jgi:hypothetical protein